MILFKAKQTESFCAQYVPKCVYTEQETKTCVLYQVRTGCEIPVIVQDKPDQILLGKGRQIMVHTSQFP